MTKTRKKQTKPKNIDEYTTVPTLEEKFFQLVQNASNINENILRQSTSMISEKSSVLESSKSISESIFQKIDDINPLYVVIESNAILNQTNNASILDKVLFMKSTTDKKSGIELNSQSPNRKGLLGI